MSVDAELWREIEALLEDEHPGEALRRCADALETGRMGLERARSVFELVREEWGASLAPLYRDDRSVRVFLGQHQKACLRVPENLRTLWGPPGDARTLVGVTAFPMGRRDDSPGVVRILRVGLTASGGASCDAEFATAIEWARGLVIERLDLRGEQRAALSGVPWDVLPLRASRRAEEGSVAMAALVAFASYALGVPVPWHLCFSGCPSGSTLVRAEGISSKRAACARYPYLELRGPDTSSSPDDIIHDVFGRAWTATMGRRPAGDSAAIDHCVVAIIAAGRVPLALTDIECALTLADWPAGMAPDHGDVLVRERLSQLKHRVLETGDGRFAPASVRHDDLGVRLSSAHRGLARHHARERDDLEAAYHYWKGRAPEEAHAALGRALSSDRASLRRTAEILAILGPSAGELVASHLQAPETGDTAAATHLQLARAAALSRSQPAPLAQLGEVLLDAGDDRERFLAAHALLEVAATLCSVYAAAIAPPRDPLDRVLKQMSARPSLDILVQAAASLAREAPPASELHAAVEKLERATKPASDLLHRRTGLSRLAAPSGNTDAARALAAMAEPLAEALASLAPVFARHPIVAHTADGQVVDVSGPGPHPGRATRYALRGEHADVDLMPHLTALDPADAGVIGFYRGIFEGRVRYWALSSLCDGEHPAPKMADDRPYLWSAPRSLIETAAPRGAAPKVHVRAPFDDLPQPIARALAAARKGRSAWLRAAAVDAAFAAYLRLVWYTLCAASERGGAALQRHGPGKRMPPIHRSVLDAIRALDPVRTGHEIASRLRDDLFARHHLAVRLVDSLERLTHIPGPMAGAEGRLAEDLGLLEELLTDTAGGWARDGRPLLIGATDASRALGMNGFEPRPLSGQYDLPAGDAALLSGDAYLSLAPLVRVVRGEGRVEALLVFADVTGKTGKGLRVDWLGVSRGGLLEKAAGAPETIPIA